MLCPDSVEGDQCIPKFKFLAVKETTGSTFSYDGIIGLAPNIEDNGISYMEALS